MKVKIVAPIFGFENIVEVEFEEIVKRLSKEELDKRPLFKDFEKAKKLFFKRDEIYTKLADFIIENKNLGETIQKIRSYYASRFK